jgi:hypothetical protein
MVVLCKLRFMKLKYLTEIEVANSTYIVVNQPRSYQLGSFVSLLPPRVRGLIQVEYNLNLH